MTKIDLPAVLNQLNILADIFERKPVGERAAIAWFDVLKEFPADRICGLLINWPKTHTKFPAPAEVWKAINEVMIFDRERTAASQRKEEFYPGVGGEQAQKFIEQIRKTLKGPKWTPREHWERVLASKAPGSIGHTFATEALKKLGARSRSVEYREPGQDDEELAA